MAKRKNAANPRGATGTGRAIARIEGLTQTELIRQIGDTIPNFGARTREERVALIDAALSFIASIAPKDASEAMLAIQMFASHKTAMACLRRANEPETSTEAHRADLRFVLKFSSLFNQQLNTLNNHRRISRQLGRDDSEFTIEAMIEAGLVTQREVDLWCGKPDPAPADPPEDAPPDTPVAWHPEQTGMSEMTDTGWGQA